MNTVKPLNDKELNAAIKALADWTIQDDALRAVYHFQSFRDAVTFLVGIGFEAEKMDHHPEITHTYKKVKVTLTTHEAGNKVTGKDIQLASIIQHLADQYPK